MHAGREAARRGRAEGGEIGDAAVCERDERLCECPVHPASDPRRRCPAPRCCSPPSGPSSTSSPSTCVPPLPPCLASPAWCKRAAHRALHSEERRTLWPRSCSVACMACAIGCCSPVEEEGAAAPLLVDGSTAGAESVAGADMSVCGVLVVAGAGGRESEVESRGEGRGRRGERGAGGGVRRQARAPLSLVLSLARRRTRTLQSQGALHNAAQHSPPLPSLDLDPLPRALLLPLLPLARTRTRLELHPHLLRPAPLLLLRAERRQPLVAPARAPLLVLLVAQRARRVGARRVEQRAQGVVPARDLRAGGRVGRWASVSRRRRRAAG